MKWACGRRSFKKKTPGVPSPIRMGDPRFAFRFHFSFATSQGCLKGATILVISGILPGLSPGRTMFDYPIRQRALKTNVMAGFFRLNPFVPKDFLALGLKFPIQRGIL